MIGTARESAREVPNELVLTMTKATAGALVSLIAISLCGCGRDTASSAGSGPAAASAQVAAKSQAQPAGAKSPEVTVRGLWNARAANGFFIMTELENTSGQPIRAFRGKLTQVDDFGKEEVIAPYEFTSQSKYGGGDNASETNGHSFADGETMVCFQAAYENTGEMQVIFLDKKNAIAILKQLHAEPAEFNKPKAGVRFRTEQVAYVKGN